MARCLQQFDCCYYSSILGYQWLSGELIDYQEIDWLTVMNRMMTGTDSRTRLLDNGYDVDAKENTNYKQIK